MIHVTGLMIIDNPLFLQYWMLSKEGEIRRDEACLDYAGSDPILYPCHGSKGNQYWEYEHEVSSIYLFYIIFI